MRERDELLHVIRTYEETFSAHQSLLSEIKQSFNEANKKKQQVGETLFSKCENRYGLVISGSSTKKGHFVTFSLSKTVCGTTLIPCVRD